MKEPAVTIQIANSETEPNAWRWNICRGDQTLISGAAATTEPKTYGSAQSAADGAIRAYGKMILTSYREAAGG